MIPILYFLCYYEKYCLLDFFVGHLYIGRLLISVSLLTKDVEHSCKSDEMPCPYRVGKDDEGAGKMPPGLRVIADPGSIPRTSTAAHRHL